MLRVVTRVILIKRGIESLGTDHRNNRKLYREEVSPQHYLILLFEIIFIRQSLIVLKACHRLSTA